MTTLERLEQLNEAMELIQQAQQMVDEAVNGTPHQNHYEAYGRYGFDQLLGNGNPYDSGLPNLIEELS